MQNQSIQENLNNTNIFKFKATYQNYVWGKSGKDSAVYQVLVREQPELDISKPYAELWMGTHKNGQSHILHNNTYLNLMDQIQKNPQKFLGDKIIEEFGFQNGLPFLFKILSVNTALSIQAHPDKKLAEQLHAQMPEIYKDDNYKPEMAVALTQYEAFSRFCTKEQFFKNLEDFPEFNQLLDKNLLEKYKQLEQKQNEQENKQILKNILSTFLQTQTSETIIQKMRNMINRLKQQKQLSQREEVTQRLYTQYPDDVGVFITLFLNFIVLQPGQSFSMDPNEPHAYLSGNCFECMANGDNVVRLGLTPKLKDTDTLINMLTYETQKPDISTGDILENNDNLNIRVYQSGYKEFKLLGIEFKNTLNIISKQIYSQSPYILIVLKGEGFLNENNQKIKYQQGNIFYICPQVKFSIEQLQDSNEPSLIYCCGIQNDNLQLN